MPALAGSPLSGGPHRSGGQSQFAPLDPPETSSHPQYPRPDDAICDNADNFRNPDSIPWEHRGWQQTRRRVFASMCRVGIPDQRRCNFWACGDRVHVMRDQISDELEVWTERCHDRFCLRCGQLRSHRIAEALEGLMKPVIDKLMFITLTVRGRPDDSLRSMIDRLREGWKELRRLKGWKGLVRGGAVMLEVKWSATSGGHWHPHYHLVVEGEWVDEQWLRDAWKLITRDSDQVNVQRIKEPRQALGYITKYASKPMDSSFTSRPVLLDEAMKTLRGIRLAACFGSWHGTPLARKVESEGTDETEGLTQWVYEGTVDDLRTRASTQDQQAADVLAAVERILRVRSLRDQRRRGDAESHGPPDADALRSVSACGM